MKRAILCAMAVLLSVGAYAVFSAGTVGNLFHTTYQSYATGTGALELYATNDSSGFQLLEVRVHLAAATTTDTLTVSVDSALGAYDDAVLATQAMTSLTDYVFRPTAECVLAEDDLLKVGCPNSAGTRYGAEILWRKR